MAVPCNRMQKKPAWLRDLSPSTTPAYSSTDHPERPGCPSSSHPTTANHLRGPTGGCPMSTPAGHSPCYALRREKSKFIRLPATELLIPDRFEGCRPKFGPLALPVPLRAFRRLWATFETGGPRVGLLKSRDSDRRVINRPSPGSRIILDPDPAREIRALACPPPNPTPRCNPRHSSADRHIRELLRQRDRQPAIVLLD